MFDEPELTNDERKLEAALSRVRPREPAIDAASIAYQAGLRVARRGVIAWRAVAAVLLVAVISMPLLRTPPRTFERIVFVTAPASAPKTVTYTAVSYASAPREPDAAPSYLSLRRDVIEYGSEALPASPRDAGRDSGVLRLGSSRLPTGGDL